MSKKEKLLIGLAGQQNAGKSTLFNMLTGARQHIANYPGVTIDKKSGVYKYQGVKIEAVDLPGTYSLTSFSLEERVARDFLITEEPDVIVNVVDSSSLKRSLYFTFQVLEMGFPVVMALNMIDVAKRNGIAIDIDRLQHRLGVDVIPTVGRKGKGKQELRSAILAAAKRKEGKPLNISYEDLEPVIDKLDKKLAETELAEWYPTRWLAVKLVEGDSEAERIIIKKFGAASPELTMTKKIRDDFEQQHYIPVADYMMGCRDRLASSIVESCVKETKKGEANISEKIDTVVLNRFAAPFFLLATVFLVFYLSIVQGYRLTQYWWPYLAELRTFIARILPDAGMLHDPYLRSMSLWMVDSGNALLNYIPIFLILFALIAILEDSGYMARIAFILDKLFHSFGLHGQSVLPYILGGVYAGGCAVPGVMATKGIPDERARMATILTVPYMNCLAKIPFYVLLVSVFFVDYKAWVMFFLSTITIFVALLVARLLTATVLRTKETAPFVMELPNYHPPTIFGVGQRSIERTWQYIKKVVTIVIAVSVCIFVLLQFPGLSEERTGYFEDRMNKALVTFNEKIEVSKYADKFQDQASILELLNLYTDFRIDRRNLNREEFNVLVAHYMEKNPDLSIFLTRGADQDILVIHRAVRSLASERRTLRRKINEERIRSSFLGGIGHSLEPITQWAGFDWKINVAILSSFAARESSVATIGVLYQQGAEYGLSLEERMALEVVNGGFTPLHALAIMVFFALYPPCLAVTIMIKVQTGSYRWMMFSIFFPTVLGFMVASVIFTGGSMVGLSGIQMMGVFYVFVVILTIIVGLSRYWGNNRGKAYELPDLTAGQR